MSGSLSPRVSFVILTCSHCERIQATLDSVLAQTCPDKEVILVVNAPSVGALDASVLSRKDVTIVCTGANLGSAAGRNRGAKPSAGEYLVFLDDDCVLESPDAAASAVASFQSDPSIGAVALRIFDPDASANPYNLGGVTPLESIVQTVRFNSGGFAIRRDVFDRVNGFFEPLFMVHVDTDLAFRVQTAGWRILRRGDIVVLHPSPIDHPVPDPVRQFYYDTRNSIWVALRHFRLGQLLTLLLPKLFRIARHSLFNGGFRLFLSGFVDGFRRMSACLAERSPLPRDVVRCARQLHVPIWK